MGSLRTFCSCLLFVGIFHCRAQGIYTEFGQNRVQYEKFQWRAFEGESADWLFNDPQLKSAISFADKKISSFLPQMENLLGYKPSNRPQFMVYGSLSDYKQNNIGYVNPQWQSGGITFIPAEALPVYFSGDYALLSTQILKGLGDFMIREMIYGGTLQDRFERLKSPALPYWFTEGLSCLISQGWGAEQETALRDGINSGVFNNLNMLNRDQQLLLGHSIWRFIVDKYGIEVISGIMFIARYTHSAEAGISYYSKIQLTEFMKAWRSYYLSEFENKTQMLLPKGKAQIPRKINKLHISGINLNDNGQSLSIVTHDHGKFSVWLYFFDTERVKKIYEGGLKVLNQIDDCSFPIAKWKDNRLYLLTFEKGNYQLLTFNPQGKIIAKLAFSGFMTVNDFALHPDNENLAFSGVRNGSADIYKSSLNGGVFEQLTNDTLYEKNLIWLKNDELAYTANASDNVKNLYRLHNGKVDRITTFNKPYSIDAPVILNDSMLGFLSDINGLKNAWFTHVYSTSAPLGLTNYARSVTGQTISGDRSTFAEIVKINNSNTIFTGMVNENPLKEVTEIPDLSYAKNWLGKSLISRAEKKSENILLPETLDTLQKPADIPPASYRYQTGFPKIDYTTNEPLIEPQKKALKTQTNLNPILPDFIVTQIDNKNLGTYLYDNNVPMPVMRNPLLMPYVKISLSDLQRNINLEAGARSSFDLAFTDFHFKAGYYAGLLDHEFSYFRRIRKYDNLPNLFQQCGTQLLEYKIMLPADERLRYSYTTGWRQDAIITKITEKQTSQIKDQIEHYWTNKLEIMFDNSISAGLNQINGSKTKLGLNYYLNPANMKSSLWSELDMRFYLPIWRNILFAQRVAGAYNLGRNKTGYYLGGVENWTQKDQMPPNPVYLNPNDLLFQTWVCNLRGFYRGARMGHSYVISNSEFRLPVMKMIYRRPLASEFLKHFTLTAFADAGCAFTGKSPAYIENPYNTKYLNTPNYAMSITSRRNPWLLGVGYGVRSRILGYFVKYDRARGWQEGRWERTINYVSLGLDF